MLQVRVWGEGREAMVWCVVCVCIVLLRVCVCVCVCARTRVSEAMLVKVCCLQTKGDIFVAAVFWIYM